MLLGKNIFQLSTFCLMFGSLLWFQIERGALTTIFDAYSYVTTVGVLFFAGVFCKGRRNRYAIITFSLLVAVIYLLYMGFFAVTPYVLASREVVATFPIMGAQLLGAKYHDSYWQLLAYPLTSYVGYIMFFYRHSLSMFVNRAFGRKWPVGETNMSLVISQYLGITLKLDVLWVAIVYSYVAFYQVPHGEYVSDFIVSNHHIDLFALRDNILMVISGYFSISLIFSTITDTKRPDILGIGQHAIYHKK